MPGVEAGRPTMYEPATLRSPSLRTRKQDDRRPSVWAKSNLGTLLAILCCGGYLLWTLLGHGTPDQNVVVSNVLSPLIAIGCTIWSLWGIGKRRADGGRRGHLSAALISLGVAGYAAGSSTYSYYELLTRQPPFPSWADAGYLTGALATIAGILLIPSRPLPAVVRVRVLLDSLMVMAALVTFSWYFALGPVVTDGEATLLARILGGAYPVADLLMVFCVLVVSSHSQEAAVRRVRNYVLWGILGYISSDVVFGYQSLHETYRSGGPIDVGWMVANFMLAPAAVALRHLPAQRTEEASEGSAIDMRAPSFWRAIAPYALVPAVLALMAYLQRTNDTSGLKTGVYVGAGTLFALIVARQFFAIAENTRLYRFLQAAYRELESLATTDSMTGLPNHRMFQDRLRAQIDRTETTGAPACLLLVDVDRFKQYNDQFGHPAGDEALRIVARVLREALRSSDFAARYGGEEFAAILPATDLAEAAIVAERLRATCAGTVFPHREVTLSIGVAQVVGQDPSALIEAADHALYAAKHAGRNQVAFETNPLIDRTAGEKPVEDSLLPSGWSLEESRTMVRERLQSSEAKFDGPMEPIVRALLAMLDLRDHDVERHSDRVMRFCFRLAEESIAQGIFPVSANAMNDLYLGALLHDIGKVGVPDAILHKPGALTEAEWAIIRRHPIQGAELLSEFPELAGAVPVVRSHHERWDGGGYPFGLAQEEIPFNARLFALADTLDAMGSDRPYRKARPYPEIRDEIVRMSGRQFDPALVEAFLAVPESEWRTIREESGMLAEAA